MDKNEPPLVSIVTPSFNSSATIEKTIQSVLQQDYLHIEHIVIDGGSTDSTLEILSRYPQVNWISEPDRGQADALNKGFRMANGEIVGWLNADDTYASNSVIGEVVSEFLAHAAIDLIHGDVTYCDVNGNVISYASGQDLRFPDAFFSNPINQQAAFFRRNVLHKIGYLRDSLHYVMDYEFWLRLASIGQSQYVPRLWAHYTLMPGSKTVEHPERFWLEALKVFDESLESLDEEVLARKGLTYAGRKRVYGRMEWLAGVGLARAGDYEGACTHASHALEHFRLLETDLPFAIGSCRFIESHFYRSPVSDDWFVLLQKMLMEGPGWKDKSFMRHARAFFYATRADYYAHHSSWPKVRRDTILAICLDPNVWLRNRGFAKQGIIATRHLIAPQLKTKVKQQIKQAR